ncbi:hypothetical protein GFC01_01965 [Desulfofundulus thermobenzoicus]|uniref:Lipoprotein n=1 Tax=Desulfofundulus thermobenzoicus TaxID=29376 RepID=A0A6N7IMB0_9FIRM|nr:hypothetical protein [Desulfofundulus thermobenzoicus]MQL51054.1 hypothetical protein [Desulfofundulus thermobenzoicus]
MKRGIAIGVICLLFPLALSGCGGKAPPTDTEEVVKNYIAAASSQNWQQAAGYLTGEALAAEGQNAKHVNDKPVTVTDEKLNTISQAENFALVDADITEMPGHDRRNYRFYLERKAGKWLIYKMEMAGPSLPARLKEGEIPDALSETLRAYVTSAVQGDWAKARQYLTGHALIQVQRQDVKNVRLRGSISGFQLTPVGTGDGYFLVRGSYTVVYPNQKPLKVDVMFTAADAAGVWKIVQVDRI